MAAELDEREGVLGSRDGTRLAWRAWPVAAPRAVLAVVHGLGEHSGRYARLAAAMGRHGCACYALDLRGMGRRGAAAGTSIGGGSGSRTALRSTTGSSSARTASRSCPRAIPSEASWSRRRCSAAPYDPGATLTLGNEVDPALLSPDPAVAAEYAADALVHDRISSRLFTEWVAASEDAVRRAGDLTSSCQLVVSEDDRIIDHRGGLAFARRAGSRATVTSYPWCYHEPFDDLGAEEVFADLASWLG